MSRLRIALLAVLAIAAPPRLVHGLPDLAPEVSDVSVSTGDVDAGDVVEGCAGGTTGRRLLHYSLRAHNLGPDDLVLGNPGCPDCQTNPGASCANPFYVCSAAHGHAHFQGFAVGELLDAGGNVVAQGRKYGFCLLDYECARPKFDCNDQGISAGCTDLYETGLPCQYIDLTGLDLPPGPYTLRVTLDPQNLLAEANESNNSTSVPVVIPESTGDCPPTVADGVPTGLADAATSYSALWVAALGDITRITVSNVGIQHPDISELEVHIISPMGTDVTLFDSAACHAADLDLNFDSSATTSVPCPATGGATVHSSGSLSAFVGEPAAGLWKLAVVDRSSGNRGMLESWQVNVCTKPTCSVVTAAMSADVPKTIPDNSSATSSITMPVGTGNVGRVELIGLRGRHTYFHDLEFHLSSPGGRDVKVLNQTCRSEDTFAFGLSDFAPTQLPCPPDDGFPHLPSNGLTAFIGDAADGNWHLTIYDKAPADTGVLDAWGLRICPLTGAPVCQPAPRVGCRTAPESSLFLRSAAAVGQSRLDWSWARGVATLEEIGDPTVDTSYALCMYRDATLVASYPILPGGTCGGSNCWTTLGVAGYQYRQRGGNGVGIARVRLSSGTNMAQIEFRGRGQYLRLPLPLQPSVEVAVQLQRSGSLDCWESRFAAPPLRSTDQRYSDRTP